MRTKAFTLIEIIIAIFLITVGSGAAFVVVQKTITFTSVSSSRLQAAYLAQEAIENVRNIRDTNYLEDANWNEGVVSGDWEEVFIGDQPSIFKRRIIITPDGEDILEISAEITWQERGGDYQVTAQTKLYDWY